MSFGNVPPLFYTHESLAKFVMEQNAAKNLKNGEVVKVRPPHSPSGSILKADTLANACFHTITALSAAACTSYIELLTHMERQLEEDTLQLKEIHDQHLLSKLISVSSLNPYVGIQSADLNKAITKTLTAARFLMDSESAALSARMAASIDLSQSNTQSSNLATLEKRIEHLKLKLQEHKTITLILFKKDYEASSTFESSDSSSRTRMMNHSPTSTIDGKGPFPPISHLTRRKSSFGSFVSKLEATTEEEPTPIKRTLNLKEEES